MPDKPVLAFSFSLPSEQDTLLLAQDIAAALRPGDVLALYGDLGAGKTTLCRGLIRTLTGNPVEETPSPTFSLVQTYQAHIPVRHFDLYRLQEADELEELGFFEDLDASITLIEWPARAEETLPARRIELTLEIAGNARRQAALSMPPAQKARFARSFQARAFLKVAGLASATRSLMPGDASQRSYERIFSATPQKPPAHAVLMNWPPAKQKRHKKNARTYAKRVHRAQSTFAFAALAELLAAQGFSAPEIYHADHENGFLLLEDLGAEPLVDENKKPILARYIHAMEALAKLHGQASKLPRSWPSRGSAYQIPPFDRQAFLTEVQLLTDWYAQYLGVALGGQERSAYLALWAAAYEKLQDAEQGLLLRDVHAPNLLWLEARRGARKIGLLDFQDALWGPHAYDIASLIYDARVSIAPQMRQALLARYFAKRGSLHCAQGAFREHIAILAGQRLSKILGLFARLAMSEDKSAYLAHLPRNCGYLVEALQSPALSKIRAWHEHYLPLGAIAANQGD